MWLLWCALACAGGLAAQSLRIYSEFQRVGPTGEVIEADRHARPREILSPMVARNAHASFHIAVTLPPGVPAWLHVRQNPDVLKARVYKENFAQGIPDSLHPVGLPVLALLPRQPEINGQTTEVFWLDLWVPAETPVGRIRCDALLNSGSEWLVAPMEVRVMPAVVRRPRTASGSFPPVTAPADAFACPAGPQAAPQLSIRRWIRRDALQDAALAGHSLCQGTPRPAELGPEWYLRARDTVLRGK